MPPRIIKPVLKISSTEPVEEAAWVAQTITMEDQNDKPRKLPAEVYGGIGIYESWDGELKGLVSVGLVAAKVRTCSVLKKEDGKRIGQYLWDTFCLACRGRTREEVRSKLPEWARPWLKECDRLRKWVDPKSFSEGGDDAA